MRRAMIAGTIVVLSLTCILFFATSAYAVPAGSRVVSTTKHSVSGADIAQGVLKDLSRVAVGSQGATVTLDVDGAPRDISLDIGDLDRRGDGPTSGLAGIGIIAALGAGLFKGATLLLRLMR